MVPFSNSVFVWLAVIALTIAVWVVFQPAKRFIIARARQRLGVERSGSWQEVVLQLLQRTTVLFIMVATIYAGAQALDLPPEIATALTRVFVVVVFVQVGLWLDRIVVLIAEWRLVPAEPESSTVRNAVSLIYFVGRVAVWSIVVLLMFDNLGVDITALVAGLGIGGIAVALAAQNILGDLFASLAIVLDKPFEVGDFIIVGDKLGTVERIGIKTTRIRSLTGEQLICANADLLGSRIHNYKRMEERRIVFNIGVTYETPAAKVRLLPDVLREVVEAQDQVRFDRAHFKSFGDFALIFEVVYWVLNADYNVYMNTQQAINLEVFRRLQELDVDFAYPTSTVYIHGTETESFFDRKENSATKSARK